MRSRFDEYTKVFQKYGFVEDWSDDYIEWDNTEEALNITFTRQTHGSYYYDLIKFDDNHEWGEYKICDDVNIEELENTLKSYFRKNKINKLF
jgi:hypothetical protein